MGRLAIHLRERTMTQRLVDTQYLEQVELDIAEVALVVPHGGLPGEVPASVVTEGTGVLLLASN